MSFMVNHSINDPFFKRADGLIIAPINLSILKGHLFCVPAESWLYPLADGCKIEKGRILL
jgi:hypothetical protein